MSDHKDDNNTHGLNIEREAQTAQQPNARVGDGQADRVPTGEGSLLGSPKTAKDTEAPIPHLKK